MIAGRVLDSLLDRSIVGGWSRLGYLARRPFWRGAQADPAPRALVGRVALVTGAGGGLGEATARGLARLGASVHLVVRDAAKGDAARERIAAAVPGAQLHVEVCDLGELGQVRAFAAELAARLPALNVLVHNAGLLPPARSETGEGNELTLAVHVLGPHLLTKLMRPLLTAGAPSVVEFVSSGGMYAQRLAVDDLQFTSGTYGGTAAYARTKRMQVELAHLWARELAGSGVTVHSLHPGWAATPGLTSSLPAFERVLGPALRSADEGADTAVWLAAAPAEVTGSGQFWQDRAPRAMHYLPGTRPTPAQQRRLWEQIEQLTAE